MRSQMRRNAPGDEFHGAHQPNVGIQCPSLFRADFMRSAHTLSINHLIFRCRIITHSFPFVKSLRTARKNDALDALFMTYDYSLKPHLLTAYTRPPRSGRRTHVSDRAAGLARPFRCTSADIGPRSCRSSGPILRAVFPRSRRTASPLHPDKR